MYQIFFLLLFCIMPLALASGTVGFVKNVSGDVFLQNDSSKVKAVKNMTISEGDTIITGSNSRVGILFKDDTALSMGPSSQIDISQFNFQPHEKKLSFITKLFKGTFTFISGQIAKLAPDQVEIQTPNATLGVRGTKFIVHVQ